ncbi:MAG: LON peptidase substrate-binding domain-containing protein [Steroidobacteraceae bacterium]
MSGTSILPLFPLNTVLFPRGPLPLRIFETRYTDMVKRCMREDACFGVVLVKGGAEVGAASGFEDIGTSARIVDFNLLPDGLLGISCRGERRFRLQRRWREADGLNMGEVEWIDAPPGSVTAVTLPVEHQRLAQLLQRVLPELGDIYTGIEMRLDDADWVGSRLVEILPINLADKQRCLELLDPLERLTLLAPLVRRVEDGDDEPPRDD